MTTDNTELDVATNESPDVPTDLDDTNVAETATEDESEDTEGIGDEDVDEDGDESEPEVKALPLESLDELSQMVVLRAQKNAESYLSVKSRVDSATEGAAALMTELIDKSEDEEIVQRRERIQKANDAINRMQAEMEDMVRPQLNIPSEEQITALKDEAAKQHKAFKQLADLFNSQADVAGLKKENDEPVTIWDYVKPLPGMRKSTGSTSTAGTTNIRRPRVKKVEVAKGLNPQNGDYKRVGDAEKSTFSHLVKWIREQYKENVETPDLHKAWFKAVSTEDFDNIPEVSTFSYSVKGNTFWVRITK